MAVVQVGMRFDRLEVVALYESTRQSGAKKRMASCQCVCGKITDVEIYNLTSGNTRQCKECAKASRAMKKKTHGHSYCGSADKIAKKCYYTWQAMKRRCTNQKDRRYASYGGRGISVCERWTSSYEKFIDDMGLPPTMDHQIDRIDNGGNYDPENCRWVTRIANANNKSNNRVIQGKTLAEMSRETGIDAHTIAARIRRGVPESQWLASEKARRRVYTTSSGNFDSIKQAAEHFGLSISGMHARFKSDTFPDYHIIEIKG